MQGTSVSDMIVALVLVVFPLLTAFLLWRKSVNDRKAIREALREILNFLKAGGNMGR